MWDLIIGLIDDSRNFEAQAMLERAVRIWPDDKSLKVLHLDFEARFHIIVPALLIVLEFYDAWSWTLT